ncbi:reverse transcriptase [Plakobranchus ocellatus]|uniref:Reverse transcriptase n=1 Tax=Plakobranchus ocellatus TaxID=259542 RepID=A0AAV3Z5W8_9GAST|nr:reverse transcriptase [Plakobranchus ocellatus]
MRAEEIFIPKEQNSTKITQFRPISQLSAEGKSFSQSWHLASQNSSSKIAMRMFLCIKGCPSRVSAVLDTPNQANLDVVWIDLANIYGSVPHQIIQKVLRKYLIPDNIQVMLEDYFNRLYMRFSTDKINKLRGWIDMGIPNFVRLGYGRAADWGASLVDLGGECYMPPLKAFIDDATILCSNE